MSSFFSRISTEMTNALNDAYGNIIYGDDAGKSAKLVFIARPKVSLKETDTPRRNMRTNSVSQPFCYHGMTFIEVNNRAYVRNVEPSSDAFKAGVQARDCVQFAVVLGDYLSALQNNDKAAAAFALQCEKKGMRTSPEQLRKLIGENCFDENYGEIDVTAGQEEYYTQSSFVNITPELSQPHSPSASETFRHGMYNVVGNCVGKSEKFIQDDLTMDATMQIEDASVSFFSQPIIFILRRTRQRKNLESFPSTVGIPSFRLDDECDRAAAFIERLTLSVNTSSQIEKSRVIVYNGNDWLLPIKPSATLTSNPISEKRDSKKNIDKNPSQSDQYIKVSKDQIIDMRNRKLVEDIQISSSKEKRSDDLETAAIRGLIQTAVGLAFVKTSKVVLGVSFNGGTGIIIARQPGGSWSPPSAIGMMGAGLGLQFGLEVVDYIFILQTRKSLDNFRRGGHFTVGGNIGAAIAGIGREAYGAASCSPTISSLQDNYEDGVDNSSSPDAAEFSHILAYARSQGLYFGVSLEGNRIYARNDINARAYKFTTGKPVCARDILDGKVPIPPEAENLYASLHSVEYNQELSDVPRPPTILRENCKYDWIYDQCSLESPTSNGRSRTFSFLSNLSKETEEECSKFEKTFKKFLFGGVSVTRLIPNVQTDKETRLERRTLWLMTPSHGGLRLGFLSKGNEEGFVSSQPSSSQNVGTISLSKKNSVALTDVICLSQNPDEPLLFRSEDDSGHLRVIFVADMFGNSLYFLANNLRESELLLCGLKLLLEKETSRVGVRGSLPLTQLGGSIESTAMSPSAARGFFLSESFSNRSSSTKKFFSSSKSDENDSIKFDDDLRGKVPEGRNSWAEVPSRNYLRNHASTSFNCQINQTEETKNTKLMATVNTPQYFHGQRIVRDVAINIKLPLPFTLCRALLLDSSSPVINMWLKKRGEHNVNKDTWKFPIGCKPKGNESKNDSKQITNGCMTGAYRDIRYERMRNSEKVTYTESQTVDSDDNYKVALLIRELVPRRGFSVLVNICLRDIASHYCEASVVTEVCPLSKKMSDQMTVHRAFLLVLAEIDVRYGTEETGLLGCFLNVTKNMPSPKQTKVDLTRNISSKLANNHLMSSSTSEDSKSSTKNMKSNFKKSSRNSKDHKTKYRENNRPGTPALDATGTSPNPRYKQDKRKKYTSNTFTEAHPSLEGKGNDSTKNDKAANAPTITVKPLPKIRLSLMPSPREEEEYESNLDAVSPKTSRRKRHHSTSKSRRRKNSV